MTVRGDIITVEICKSHMNPDTNPVVGIIRDGPLANLVAIFDKWDSTSRGLTVGKFAKVRVLHVLPRSMVIKFLDYVDPPLYGFPNKP